MYSHPCKTQTQEAQRKQANRSGVSRLSEQNVTASVCFIHNDDETIKPKLGKSNKKEHVIHKVHLEVFNVILYICRGQLLMKQIFLLLSTAEIDGQNRLSRR